MTWDTRPTLLQGDVQWQIACNRSLADAFANPDYSCISSSTSWDSAFESKDYDYVMVQPFYGTTLAEDARVISQIMDRQPRARIMIHTSWSSANTLEQVYESRISGEQMRPSAEYYDRLLDDIRQSNPDRIVESDHVVDMLHAIATDIDAGRGPFNSLSELFRDEVHLNETGRYLAHNAVRAALGQPLSREGFDLNDATRRYLNGKILSERSREASETGRQSTRAVKSANSVEQQPSVADAVTSQPFKVPGFLVESSRELAVQGAEEKFSTPAVPLSSGDSRVAGVPEPTSAILWMFAIALIVGRCRAS